jgi:predicted nucleotidyltransferase
MTHMKLDSTSKEQIHQCIIAMQEILRQDLLGMYLYGSSLVGGLQKYSDIDLFVVTSRATTHAEKDQLIAALLVISGLYMKEIKRPIELTIVEKTAINPWQYPPHFDFQYGEWLREPLEQGARDLWSTKEMPDLALLITQVLLASTTLVGIPAHQLICPVPYKDCIAAIKDALPSLLSEIESDTRNVLLTLARIWSTVTTDTIRSKPAAADWVINRLPEQYQPVMERAKAICIGKEKEHWGDMQERIKPCAQYMLGEVRNILSMVSDDDLQRSIKIA